MSGRVDQVQDISLAILGGVFDPHGVGFDRDAAFPFDIHRVEKLCFHIPFGHGAGQLNEPVSEGRFSVVDMGHDREISDARKWCHKRGYEAETGAGQGGMMRYTPRAHGFASILAVGP